MAIYVLFHELAGLLLRLQHLFIYGRTMMFHRGVVTMLTFHNQDVSVMCYYVFFSKPFCDVTLLADSNIHMLL